MVRDSWCQFRRRFALLIVLLVACLPTVAQAQEQRPQLAVQDLLALLETELPETRILQMVAEACVIRGADPEVQRQLEQAGASPALRRTVEAFACPGVVAVVTVTPSRISVAMGDTLQLSATPRDASGNALTGRTMTWTSSNTSQATVNGLGLVTGVSTGTLTVTATSEGQSGFATVTVTESPPPSGWLPVATVEVLPSGNSMAVEEVLQLMATPREVSGNALTGRTVVWTSSDTSRATVDGSGLVTGLSAGPVTITAMSEGQGGSATVTVIADPPPSGRMPVAEGPPQPSGMLGVGFADDQFTLIPAGTFQMGSTNGRTHERPVHTVTLTRSFYMQKTEVTQSQWREIMGTDPSHFDSCGDTCPVEQVTWNEVQQFLAALNQRYPGRNYRLPTEAEWEYAARAGTTGDYGGTGDLDEMGWYIGDSESRTHPVARKVPNAWGLYDMHGNVWEWVQDWYSSGYYGGSPGADPTGPATGSGRVLRGGSWDGSADSARAAFRINIPPSIRFGVYGFRLARTP